MGNHTQYSKRYPSDFAQYEDKGDKRTRTVNTYDNSVLYNDFIVDSIFSMLNTYSHTHNKIRISALYFSDHGENVYDKGDYAGHDYSDHIPNANVEIPFIIWLSPSQREYTAIHYPQLAERQHTPYMIDDLFHTLINISGIATPCFDKTRSFINPTYDSTRVRTLENGGIYTK
jgi:heptose-I-phosphate ethanolaminephosphotransferase